MIKFSVGHRLAGDALRYFVVSLLGLSLDLFLAYSFVRYFGFSLVAAAATSFALVATIVYFVHEQWTFSTSSRKTSLRRLFATALSSLIVLSVRLLTLNALAQIIGIGQHDFLLLLCATGISFVANFVLSRAIVGRAAGSLKQGRQE